MPWNWWQTTGKYVRKFDEKILFFKTITVANWNVVPRTKGSVSHIFWLSWQKYRALGDQSDGDYKRFNRHKIGDNLRLRGREAWPVKQLHSEKWQLWTWETEERGASQKEQRRSVENGWWWSDCCLPPVDNQSRHDDPSGWHRDSRADSSHSQRSPGPGLGQGRRDRGPLLISSAPRHLESGNLSPASVTQPGDDGWWPDTHYSIQSQLCTIFNFHSISSTWGIKTGA